MVVQARNGFYWASAFLIIVISALLLSVPESARANSALWVPAILVINLQITTFFFVAGLMLLERDEGTLNALAVSPLSPSGYLATRTVSLTALAAAETIAIVWIGFGTSGAWLLITGGTAALGVIYTGFGAAVAHTLRLGERSVASGLCIRRAPTPAAAASFRFCTASAVLRSPT